MAFPQIPKNSYCDPDLLQREYYNPNPFKVIFVRQIERDEYVLNSGKQIGPQVAECQPDGFLYLPHGYYRTYGKGLEQGEPFNMVINLEKMMFKGNKVPSNPYSENG